MNFGARSTICFRQGHAIHKLAEKVFRLLRSDPTGFVSRVSKAGHTFGWLGRGIRQTRSIQSRRTAAADRSVNLVIPLRSCRATGPGSPSMKHRRNIRKNVLGGVEARDGGCPGSSEPDRRSTYNPWMAFLNDSGSVLTTSWDELRPAIQVPQRDIGYRESLMKFFKDLEPTAHKVAQRKLQALGSAEAPSSSRSPTSQQIPEEPFYLGPCPRPIARPPIPTERAPRVTVLGLTNAKSTSFNRNNGEKPSDTSALQADPLPLPVDRRGSIDLNRRATATSDTHPRLSVQAISAVDHARPFSFDLTYLRSKLEEMNRNNKGLQIIAADRRRTSVPLLPSP